MMYVMQSLGTAVSGLLILGAIAVVVAVVLLGAVWALGEYSPVATEKSHNW